MKRQKRTQGAVRAFELPDHSLCWQRGKGSDPLHAVNKVVVNKPQPGNLWVVAPADHPAPLRFLDDSLLSRVTFIGSDSDQFNSRPVSMPRHARIVAAGYLMHAILRGIDRGAIFFAEDDRRAFLSALAELTSAESVRVHAYVLMTNHVHLLMTPATDSGPSRVMKGVGQRYVQRVNRTYRRTGTLFDGRFRSSLVEADGYLLACQRYIELNPVRARMVEAPGG